MDWFDAKFTSNQPPLVACTSPPITLHIHSWCSARHKRSHQLTTVSHSKGVLFSKSANPWQRVDLCCHTLMQGTLDIGKRHLYRYSQVVLHLITQLITIPVILEKKIFLLVINTTSILCILCTL